MLLPQPVRGRPLPREVSRVAASFLEAGWRQFPPGAVILLPLLQCLFCQHLTGHRDAPHSGSGVQPAESEQGLSFCWAVLGHIFAGQQKPRRPGTPARSTMRIASTSKRRTRASVIRQCFQARSAASCPMDAKEKACSAAPCTDSCQNHRP
eukprot:scaffold40161_cov71-Phaeocystis_antarctica.AAC.1